MNKKLEKEIKAAVAAQLASCPRADNGDVHSDYIDNIAFGTADEFGVSEDDVRYAANLPR